MEEEENTSSPAGSSEFDSAQRQHSPNNARHLTSSTVDRLPPNVIEHILYAVDANTFASLALLNRQWRQAAESAALYAHHLSHCPSYSWSNETIPTTVEADSITHFKRQFMKEVRRNAFDVFLRPRRTLVKLISDSMSSATAFPQGEVFRFSFSVNGQMVLCISSSRVVVLDVASDPVAVKHELQTRRRPLGATVRDDGALLAVLSSTHRVNIYRLSNNDAEHIQVLTLNDAPRDVTLSPTGSVLALAFEDSIEVYAVGKEALPTERRAVRCLRVDSLAFSPDGSMLLGSPTNGEQEGVVTITPPFYTEVGAEASPEEVHMRMWTSQILFPETISGFTHACLIAANEEVDDSWVLGYDIQLASFRVIRMKNTDAGIVYLVSPFLTDENRERLPSVIPATDGGGELVSLGFQDSGLWVYGIPRHLVFDSTTGPTSEAQNNSHGTQLFGDHHCTGLESAPRDNMAQLDKIVRQPKALIRGRRVTDMHGITSARWVSTAQPSNSRRLVAVAPGGVRPQNFGEEDVPVDGGRVLVLDFERTTTNGETAELDIELGETAPKLLEEPNSPLDAEVEIERRRTRIHRGDTLRPLGALGQQPSALGSRRPASRAIPHLRRFSVAVRTASDEADGGDIQDIPYDNTQPRSRDTLHRAATAAASTRGRYDPRYRSTPRRGYLPHESDADNWVPPPPPYSREADRPLPEHLRRALLPRATAAESSNNASSQPVQRAQTTRVVRQTQQAPPRPQSAILQRLGTITGSRRTGRDRRNSTVISGDNAAREQPNHHQAQLVPQTSPPNPVPSNDVSQMNQNQTARQVSQMAAGQSTNNQPLPTFSMDPAEHVPTQSPAPNLDANARRESYYPYSMSSPNLLHIPQPQGNALESSLNENLPGSQPSMGRRVSTEPASLPPPQNENWRRRIEDWNEHTIKERNRFHRRSKCFVM